MLRRLHCTDGRTPVATYVKRDGDKITQAFTVFSGRPQRPAPASPGNVVNVTVRSRPGRVSFSTELTWTADGAQLVISGTDALQAARQLLPVRADDPRLRLDPRAAADWANEN